MQIILKADLEMEDVLPTGPTAASGDVVLELPDGACIPDAIAATSLKPEESFMVSVNNAIIVKSNRDAFPLNDGDTVTVLAPLRGG